MRRLLHPVLVAGAGAGIYLSISCATGSVAIDERDARMPSVPPPIERGAASPYEAALLVQLSATKPEEAHGLHNVFQLSENIVSGSEPEGEAAFRKLQEMGVRTVLSVDGKVPDVELAAKYGMTYVHIPIQYRGVTEEERLEIAKTFREKEGPFYVHCFHGRHRGPAAAAIGRIVRDGATREQALAEMRQWCGTSDKYDGLYRTIADAPIPTAAETRAHAFDFPAARQLRGFRHAMIEVSRSDDHLLALSKRGWQPDAEHPDVDPWNEASTLATTMAACKELEDVQGKPSDFRGWLDDAILASAELRDELERWRETKGETARIDAAYKRLTASCSACHKAYRN